MHEQDHEDQPQTFGFCAVIGPTNAGKSTLVNHLVGAKVTIVSHKVQTTRSRILGIALHGAAQMAFIDTPGIFKPKRRLDRAMIGAAWSGVEDADAALLVIDAQSGMTDDVIRILEQLKKQSRPVTLALNKIDLIRRDTLLALADKLAKAFSFDAIFMISALKGDGVADLMDHMAKKMPRGPWMFPEDQLSDMPQMLLAAEIVRERLYQYLHQELPYALTVETELWQNQPDGSARIEITIYVERTSQRQIVLGKGGQKIKRIGSEARQELIEICERPIHLFLFVKVREGWQDDPERYRLWNLDFNAG